MDIYKYIKIFENLGLAEHLPQNNISERCKQFNTESIPLNLSPINMFNLPNAFMWKIESMPEILYRTGTRLNSDDYIFYHHPQSPQVNAYEAYVISQQKKNQSIKSFSDFFNRYIQLQGKQVWIVICKKKVANSLKLGNTWNYVKKCFSQTNSPSYLLEYLETSYYSVRTNYGGNSPISHVGTVSIYKNYNIKTDTDNILYGYHSDNAENIAHFYTEQSSSLLPMFDRQDNPRTTWVKGPEQWIPVNSVELQNAANLLLGNERGTGWENNWKSISSASSDQSVQAKDCVKTWLNKLTSLYEIINNKEYETQYTPDVKNKIVLNLFNNWIKTSGNNITQRSKRNISYDWLTGTNIQCTASAATASAATASGSPTSQQVCQNKCEIEHTLPIMISGYMGTLFNTPISFEDSSKISNQWKLNGSFAKITKSINTMRSSGSSSDCPGEVWVLEYHQIMMFLITLFRGPMYGYSNVIGADGSKNSVSHVDEIVGPNWLYGLRACSDSISVNMDEWLSNITPAPLNNIFENLQNNNGRQPQNVSLLNVYGNSSQSSINMFQTYSWIISDQNHPDGDNATEISNSIDKLQNIISKIPNLYMNYLNSKSLNDIYSSFINDPRLTDPIIKSSILYICRIYSQIVQRMIRITNIIDPSSIQDKINKYQLDVGMIITNQTRTVTSLMGLSNTAVPVSPKSAIIAGQMTDHPIGAAGINPIDLKRLFTEVQQQARQRNPKKKSRGNRVPIRTPVRKEKEESTIHLKKELGLLQKQEKRLQHRIQTRQDFTLLDELNIIQNKIKSIEDKLKYRESLMRFNSHKTKQSRKKQSRKKPTRRSRLCS